MNEIVTEFISKAERGDVISVADCEKFINEVPRFTVKHGIEDTRKFLAYLGNPDENMKIIHVAGTNGKGSVCCYMQSVLLKAGYQVGLFTSPHAISL